MTKQYKKKSINIKIATKRKNKQKLIKSNEHKEENHLQKYISKTSFETNNSQFSNYYSKIVEKVFNDYAGDILSNLILKEKNKENRTIISENILFLYNITPKHRKSALNYLFRAFDIGKFEIEIYFKAVLVFDKFLINFSKSEKNLEKCKNFFMSSKKNEISVTKLITYTLCCFYVVNQIYSTNIFNLDNILNLCIDEKITYKELIELTDNIIIYIDCDLDDVEIYQFFSLYLFDLEKRIETLINEREIFLKNFKESVAYYSAKFVQNIDLLDISPSIQALGIVLVCFRIFRDEIKNIEEKNLLIAFFEKWTNELIELIDNFDERILKNVYNWLIEYCEKKNYENN